MKNKILMKIAGEMIDTIRFWCLKRVEQYNGYYKYKKIFTEINPDLSQQYTIKANVTPFYELDVRNQHCFQALFTAKAIKKLKGQGNMPGGGV